MYQVLKQIGRLFDANLAWLHANNQLISFLLHSISSSIYINNSCNIHQYIQSIYVFLHYSALLLCCCAVYCEVIMCCCVLCVLLCCAALLSTHVLCCALLLCAVWSFSSQSQSTFPGGSASVLVDEIHDFRPDTKNRVLPAVYISDEIDNEMKGEVKFCWWIPNQHCWPSPTFKVYLTHLLQYHTKIQIYNYLTILCPIMQ